MKNAQKMIKSIAIIFATFLIFSIIASIMFSVSALENIFNDNPNYENLSNLKVDNNASVLNIDVDNTNITIQTGEVFALKTNSEYIKTIQKDNQLTIREETHNWFFDQENHAIVIEIPKDYAFDAVTIHSKAGKINIKSFHTKLLTMDLGAGKAVIRDIAVSENANIDTGAGKFVVDNGELQNLKMNMGAGKVSLQSKIYGNSEINCGVGAVDIKLIGTEKDYKIDIDKGIGTVNVLGLNKENDSYGSGIHQINVDGGVGSIDISLID